MAQYAYTVLRHIPKSERFTLGAEIRESIWRGLKLIVRASASRRRLPLLQDLDTEVKTLLALLRVGHGLGVVPDKKYQLMSARLVEIGKMLGGWIKSAR
jgi:hypothetical protein